MKAVAVILVILVSAMLIAGWFSTKSDLRSAYQASDELDSRLERFNDGLRRARQSIKESDEKFAEWFARLDNPYPSAEEIKAVRLRLESERQKLQALKRSPK